MSRSAINLVTNKMDLMFEIANEQDDKMSIVSKLEDGTATYEDVAVALGYKLPEILNICGRGRDWVNYKTREPIEYSTLPEWRTEEFLQMESWISPSGDRLSPWFICPSWVLDIRDTLNLIPDGWCVHTLSETKDRKEFWCALEGPSGKIVNCKDTRKSFPIAILIAISEIDGVFK